MCMFCVCVISCLPLKAEYLETSLPHYAPELMLEYSEKLGETLTCSSPFSPSLSEQIEGEVQKVWRKPIAKLWCDVSC